jgi:hypothetical protein
MYSALYADLCKHLSQVLSVVPTEEGQPMTFQKALLKRCQSEFDERTIAQDEEDGADDQQSRKKRTQRWGIIKFIG